MSNKKWSIPIQHSWNLSPKEAIALQHELQALVKVEALTQKVRYIAGADISFNKGDDTVYAGIVVLELPDLKEVARATLITKANFPYVPGLLSFRESPPLLEVWKKLPLKPDVLMLDGHGLAHNRRFGLACHFGLLTDCPTIGCAKKLFVGKHDVLGDTKGSIAYLHDKGEEIGAVLRTRDRVHPVYISVGYRVTLKNALDLALQCAPKYRIPIPTRQAHIVVNELRRANG